MKMAETNAERMAILSPLGGMAVLKSIWKSNTMAEVQEGEEIRAGVPIVDIVDPNSMRVRARVNQGDINGLQTGQSVQVGSTPTPSCTSPGRVAQISPLGVMSNPSNKVRAFVVLIDIEGSHPNLMPDLTASLDVELARTPAALVVPLDAAPDGDRAFVSVQRGSSFEERQVTLGAKSAHEVVVALRHRRRRRRGEKRGEERGRRHEMKGLRAALRRPRNVVLVRVTMTIVVCRRRLCRPRQRLPDLPTAEVKKGEFVDTLEIRGDIRPLRRSS